MKSLVHGFVVALAGLAVYVLTTVLANLTNYNLTPTDPTSAAFVHMIIVILTASIAGIIHYLQVTFLNNVQPPQTPQQPPQQAPVSEGGK